MIRKNRGKSIQKPDTAKRRRLPGVGHTIASDRRSQLEQGARRINRKARPMMRDQRFIWHVVFVPPQKEYIAQKIISQWIDQTNCCPNGHPFGCVYLPLNARWRRESRFSRKKKRFAYPVIPGCLFFASQSEMNCWYELLKLHIVSGVMRIGDRPVSISGKDLERFISRNRDEIELQHKHCGTGREKPLVSGDQANVINGPFEGCRVDIEAVDGRNAKVLLNILGGVQEVDIAMARLEHGS